MDHPTFRSIRLRRERVGHPRYSTFDGRFVIERIGNGSWQLLPQGTQAQRALAVSDGDRPFTRLTDAREWLAGSTYDWLDHHAAEIDAEYERLLYERTEER